MDNNRIIDALLELIADHAAAVDAASEFDDQWHDKPLEADSAWRKVYKIRREIVDLHDKNYDRVNLEMQRRALDASDRYKMTDLFAKLDEWRADLYG